MEHTLFSQTNQIEYILDEFGLGFLIESENENKISDLYSKFTRNPEETKWIAISSFFFGVPGVLYLYKYVGKDHPLIRPIMVYSVFLIFTTIFSANYWRDAQIGWRRNVDLILSKITFSMGCLCNLFYVGWFPLKMAIFSLLPFMWYCYSTSSVLLEQANPEWVTYHFTFHILLAIGAISVLRGMEINKL
jgi:hypothetical protein